MQPTKSQDPVFTWKGAFLGLMAYLIVMLILLVLLR